LSGFARPARDEIAVRVFFDDRRGAYAPHTGIGRYAALCAQGLEGHPDVTLVRASDTLGRLGKQGIVEPAWVGKLLADQVAMPLGGRGVDVHHAVWQETSPLIRTPLVLTIHDLSMQTSTSTYSRFQRAYYGSLLKLLTRKARVVTVPSESTAADVAAFFPTVSPRIAANPIDPIFLDEGRAPVEDVDSLEAPYLLYTGGQHARKDLSTLLRGTAAVQRSGEFEGSLVVTGPNHGEGFVKRAESFGCRVTMTGAVDMERLRDLYRGATAVVSASFSEGFGYSAAEAIACGKPIVCPDRGATPETARAAAVTFEAGNPDDLARAISDAVADDGSLRARVAAEREAIKDRFSVERAAQDLQDCYKAALV
jgi:glycosyltransferase involved in cell wall biosynthesis